MSNVTPLNTNSSIQHPELKDDDALHRSVIDLIPPHEQGNKKSSDGISLDAVFAEFQQWRANKPHMGTPIPDTLWHKLFQLAAIHSPLKVRALFNVNVKQYEKKWAEFHPVVKKEPPRTTEKPNATSASIPAAPEPDFCEIKIKPSTYKPEPLPCLKTMVVEFYRTDGQRMSIHTTQDSITELLQAFFKG